MTDRFWRQAVEDHENMVAALKNRDSKRLGQILRDHLCNKLEVASLGDVIEDEAKSLSMASS